MLTKSVLCLFLVFSASCVALSAASGSCDELSVFESCISSREGAQKCIWCETEMADKTGGVASFCFNEEQAQLMPREIFRCVSKDGVYSLISEDEARNMFNLWKTKYGKVYESENEESYRFRVFKESVEKIDAHNSDKTKTYKLAVNKFADLTWEEFQFTHLASEPQNCSATSTSTEKPKGRIIPDSIDWRDYGAVSPVKDQGNCGSCWTFSTTGCLESHHYLKTGNMTLLSEQQLVDCAYAFNNKGCDGGLPSQAFEYIRFNGGIDTEDSYPYTAKDGTCVYDTDNVGATVSSVFNISYQDENELTAAVGLVGPVSIAFECKWDLQFYSGGVYSNDNCFTSPKLVNHAVLAVGYDTDPTAGDYWIVKNSWSSDWGLDGYFYIVRGENMCGLADCASYPIV